MTALETRATAAEATNTSQTTAISGLTTRVTATETTDTSQTTDIAALAARTATLEGDLTPSDLVGDYAIVGLQTRLGNLTPPYGQGIEFGGSTLAGTLKVVLVGNVARLKSLERCEVGKVAFLNVFSATQVSGQGPARLDGPGTTPNPCTLADWGTTGPVVLIDGNTVSFVVDFGEGDGPESVRFYAAAGGRLWVVDSLNGDLIEKEEIPEDPAQLVMLVKKTP